MQNKYLVLLSVCFVFVTSYSHAQEAEKNIPSLEKFSAISSIVQDKCMSCHTRNYKLPFYASIPGIKQIIEKDFNDGLRAMDLQEELINVASSKPVGEATLAKMEWVMVNETMPPAKFTAVHWGSRISSAERKRIIDWVAEERAKYYATKLAIPARANEPLQPVPIVLTNAKKVALGDALFHDKRLSGDNTISCASCHAVEKAFTDNRQFSEGVRKQVGDINAPTALNAVFNVKQFWNGRAKNLQDQAGGPPFNPVEMDSKDWAQIIAKVQQDTDFSKQFLAVYKNGWTGENITDAIAEYEKTLVTTNGKFDRWLKGDNSAMNKEELEGYELFKRYRCASCHVGKSVGGQSFEYMDLKKDYFADRGNPLPSDEGLAGFTKKATDIHKFKVPNLRNIELTAPYLHDGTVKTLDEAVRIMGVYLSGMDIPQQDRKKVVLFLRTLTGEYKGQPVQGIVVTE